MIIVAGNHRWGEWHYGGYETDMRTCACGECPGADYRQHDHTWKTREDPYAPVGLGITLRVCGGPTGCGETRGN